MSDVLLVLLLVLGAVTQPSVVWAPLCPDAELSSTQGVQSYDYDSTRRPLRPSYPISRTSPCPLPTRQDASCGQLSRTKLARSLSPPSPSSLR
ncbi:hypothetical protein BDY21DRAFT_341229 [Lineolata rhizophorae]|uniref:Uncharacterized protein n=1 Tax=Lineolata rhizophorae TaxID=578093 RepID=A0A6A6P3Z2_9PEZI|nr:hypothetical protein BDY21DRAFT_341229 [Lineolata rhizophorae]